MYWRFKSLIPHEVSVFALTLFLIMVYGSGLHFLLKERNVSQQRLNALIGTFSGFHTAIFLKAFSITLFLFYKNIFYNNIEADVCEILRIL